MNNAARKTITYTCPFVPAEWIAAHSLHPSRIIPGVGRGIKSGIGAGVCPFVRAFMHSAITDKAADAVIVTTMCDQMRRLSEVLRREGNKPVFLMNVPRTWETANSLRMYSDELERLGRFLVGLGGIRPDKQKLTQTMIEYEEMRSKIRDSRSSVSPREYSELIARFHRDGSMSSSECGSPTPPHSRTPILPHGVPLALIGGPLLSEHFDIFNLIEDSGGYVALDATETGERTLPAPFDRRRLADDPFGTLVDAYFGSIPDSARRPNSLLYQWLKRSLAERGVRGVIFMRHVWCDSWHAEAQRMKEWLQMPFFDLDIAEDGGHTGRNLTRFQAFMEMLR